MSARAERDNKKKSKDGAEEEFEGYEVTKPNNKGVAVQMMHLQQLRSLVDERRATGERSHDQPISGNANGTIESKREEQLKRNLEASHFLSRAKEKGMEVKREMDAAATQKITYDLSQEVTRTTPNA